MPKKTRPRPQKRKSEKDSVSVSKAKKDEVRMRDLHKDIAIFYKQESRLTKEQAEHRASRIVGACRAMEMAT